MKLGNIFSVSPMLTRGGDVNPYKIILCNKLNIIKDYELSSFNTSIFQ